MSARARLIFRLLGAAALLALGQAVFADEVANVKFVGGGDHQLSGGLDVAYASASGTVAGLGGTVYSNNVYKQAVGGAHASLYHGFDDATYGIRGYATPETQGSSAYGGTLFTEQNTGEMGDPYQGLWGLNASWLQQTARPFAAAAGPGDKTFNEGVAEFVSRQNYYNAFHFQLTASYFVYDQPLGAVRAYRTVFLQNDIATLGTLFAVTEPPRWNASLQYARVVNGGTDNAWDLVLSYSRIGLLVDARFLNSYMFGVQFPLPGGLHAEVGYNGVEGNALSFSSFGGLTLTYYWR